MTHTPQSDGEKKVHPFPPHGGPQRWQDLRRGIVNRKQTIRQRNQQIKSLKDQLDQKEKELQTVTRLLKQHMILLEIESKTNWGFYQEAKTFLARTKGGV